EQEIKRDVPVTPTIGKPPEQKTVIIGKRKSTPIKDKISTPEEQRVIEPADPQDLPVSPGNDAYAREADTGRMDVRVKDPIYRAKDDIFGGKGVMRTEGFSARDPGHISTRIVQKKSVVRTGEENKEESQDHSASEPSEAPHKKRKITTKKDDFSWI
ncbi:MAG: hypothetical protein CVV34_02175, partial [Methanomicrobiales archaeon HGW-Methanomicrobiales-5]